MAKNIENVSEVTEAVIDVNEIQAKIIKEDDGFHVVDKDGTVGPVCKLVDEGDKTIALTPNASNRKWFNKARAEQEIEKNGYCALYYKASKTFGPQGTKLPNAKLIAYLSEAEQAEYKAIIERAMKAREDAKAKPMTEMEKAQARLAKAKEALAKLEAQAAEGNN